MAMHMLEGLALGMRASQAMVGQRERLLSLGRLSAGLTHELNNPAAAAVRATATLRERVSKMRRKLAHLATADIDPEALEVLTELQEAAVERMAKAEKLTPMQVGEAEDELDRLAGRPRHRQRLGPGARAGRGRGEARLAGRDRRQPARSSAGRRHPLGGVRAGDRAADGRDRGLDPPDLRPWSARPSSTPSWTEPRTQDVDVHDGLNSTLVMLRPQDQGVRPDHAWSRSSPRTCRWCPRIPPS